MASYPYDDCGSGWPRDFPEYGMASQEGDIAVHRMVTLITTEVRMGRCRRIELEGRVKLGIDWVRGLGHEEVLGEVPQGDIRDAIDRACLLVGWERLVA